MKTTSQAEEVQKCFLQVNSSLFWTIIWNLHGSFEISFGWMRLFEEENQEFHIISTVWVKSAGKVTSIVCWNLLLSDFMDLRRNNMWLPRTVSKRFCGLISFTQLKSTPFTTTCVLTILTFVSSDLSYRIQLGIWMSFLEEWMRMLQKCLRWWIG